jgi:hypothetical protein
MEHRGGESSGWGGTSPATVRNTMLVMLSLAAGCVDAVGYLGLGQIFVANMTGNTVLLGLALGQAKGQAALRAMVGLAGFVVGVASGAAVFGPGRERSAWPPTVTAALALELVVLVAFAVGWFLAEAEPAVWEWTMSSYSSHMDPWGRVGRSSSRRPSSWLPSTRRMEPRSSKGR